MPLKPELRRKIKTALRKLTFISQFNKNIQLKYQDVHPVEFSENLGDTRGLMKLLNESLERNVNTLLYNKERRINPQEKQQSRIPWYIFQEEQPIKLIWDTYILILLLYLAWTVPSSLVFDEELTVTSMVLEFWVDVFFILDLLVNFFVTFEIRGVLQNKLSVIAKHYLSNGFWFDLVCSFPLNWILIGVNLGSAMQIVTIKQLLRLVRVLKIGPKLVMVFNYLKMDPPTVRLIISIVSLIFLLHYVACGYWWLSVQEYGGLSLCPDGTSCWTNLCICSSDAVLPHDILVFNTTNTNWYSGSNPDQWVPTPYLFQTTEPYFVALYWAITAITSVGMNIIPRSKQEYIYTIVVILIGVLFYAILISNISTVINSRDLIEIERVNFLDKIQTFMRKNNVPNYFYTTICDYYRNLWKNEDPVHNDDLFNRLPLSLKRNLRKILWRDLANQYKILQLLDVHSYYYVVSHLVKKTYLPGEIIVRKNELADTMFFVSKGKVDAVSLDDITVYYTIYPGELFGEMCFLSQGLVKRECTFRAVNYVDVYMLSRNIYNTVCLSAPEFVGAIQFTSNSRKKFSRRESILVNTNLTNSTVAVKIKETSNAKIYELYGSKIKVTQVAPLPTVLEKTEVTKSLTETSIPEIIEEVAENQLVQTVPEPSQQLQPTLQRLNFGPAELKPLSLYGAVKN